VALEFEVKTTSGEAEFTCGAGNIATVTTHCIGNHTAFNFG
jgi:hypothetical protein